ncbi:MAG: methyltransferase domain-containing protein, partial [Gammaproteobacteria bacterium]
HAFAQEAQAGQCLGTRHAEPVSAPRALGDILCEAARTLPVLWAFLLEGRRYFPGIRLVQGLADRLPFRARQFDHVICSDVLIHVADMVTALREIVRVSRGEVLLRLRTGDGSFQGSKMIYDPEQERLFSRVLLDGKWCYFYYNVVLEADIRAMLAHVGVRDFRLFDISDGRDGRMATTKVFFKVPADAAQASSTLAHSGSDRQIS